MYSSDKCLVIAGLNRNNLRSIQIFHLCFSLCCGFLVVRLDYFLLFLSFILSFIIKSSCHKKPIELSVLMYSIDQGTLIKGHGPCLLSIKYHIGSFPLVQSEDIMWMQNHN